MWCSDLEKTWQSPESVTGSAKKVQLGSEVAAAPSDGDEKSAAERKAVEKRARKEAKKKKKKLTKQFKARQ